MISASQSLSPVMSLWPSRLGLHRAKTSIARNSRKRDRALPSSVETVAIMQVIGLLSPEMQ